MIELLQSFTTGEIVTMLIALAGIVLGVVLTIRAARSGSAAPVPQNDVQPEEDQPLTKEELAKVHRLIPYFGIDHKITLENALILTRNLQAKLDLLDPAEAAAVRSGRLPPNEMIVGAGMTAAQIALVSRYLKYLEAHLATGPSTPPPGA